MKHFARNIIPLFAATAIALGAISASAGPITMSATYYTIAENDQDMNHLASGVFNNEVQTSLGADGLPVLNTSAFGCASGCFMNTPAPADLTSTGEITWWSPSLNKGGAGGVSDVSMTSTGTITLPYMNTSFFPPNGTGSNDANGFQAAVFSTVLNVPTSESVTFSVGADDVAFVYLDGKIVCDLGGVHPDSPGTCTSGTLAAGSNNLELFFADIHQTASALTFDVTTSGVTGSPTPEPGTAVLFVLGLAGLALVVEVDRRRRVSRALRRL